MRPPCPLTWQWCPWRHLSWPLLSRALMHERLPRQLELLLPQGLPHGLVGQHALARLLQVMQGLLGLGNSCLGLQGGGKHTGIGEGH